MNADVEAKPKTQEEVKDVMIAVARVSGGFEGVIKAVEPALSLSQWAALDYIVHNGECRPFVLGKKLSISRQLAWQAGKKLEKSGLVTVTAPAEDSRAVLLTATSQGIALSKAIEARFDEIAAALSKDKPKIGLGAVRQALSAMALIIDQRQAADD